MTSTFDSLRQFLYERSGLSLEGDKLYLVESRLLPIAREAGLADLAGLMKRLQGGDRDLAHSVVDAMTTNETFFFRDRAPFEKFRNVMLPQLLAARAAERRLRIWCAACSTGQEPYSLAMLLDEEARRLTGWNVEILATDLSRRAIESARQGLYSQFEVQRGLPITMLLRYFQRAGDRWQINEFLRSRINFREFNLMSDFRPLGAFDVIFCRNVLLYFDVPTKRDILARLSRALAPDGFLLMGSAETVIGLSDAFVPHQEHPTLFVHKATQRQRPELMLVAN
ncbi:MAG: chemotaxis protein methyltransferase CheR [Methylobacteriaceae bacterium]|nr:chemotaxis protein methyltransferase CheR [Methylobacteriaceae bacterium]